MELVRSPVALQATQIRADAVSLCCAQAAPSIADAFAACVADGASTVVVSPYFLSPGRHWQEDLPALTAAAAAAHPGVRYMVAAPLGLHPLVSQVRRVLCLRDGRHAC